MRERLGALIVCLLIQAGCSAGGGEGGAGGGPPPPADTLAWAPIPSLLFAVGSPVSADVGQYLTDSRGGAVVSLDHALPAGLSLDDGVITGTPTGPAATSDYRAIADPGIPGEEPVESAAFTIEVIVPAPGGLSFEVATPHQIGMYLPLGATAATDASATVRYRGPGETAWRTGHPLVRIVPGWNGRDGPVPPVDALAGTIFDLEPGTPYEIEVKVTKPSGVETHRTVASTRALPGPGGPATARATPASDLRSVLNALRPGDVLEIANGTYDVPDGLPLDLAGTPGAPITIRGESRDGVVIRRSRSAVLVFLRASHVIVEDLTLEGSGVDSFTSGSTSLGIDFWDGNPHEFVTLRRLLIRGVDQGIVASSPLKSVLIHDCELRGNNLWNAEFVDSSRTWDDDGIRIPGEGNCAFHNTLKGFGDSLAVSNGILSAGVYFYLNRITMTGDDACEGDYGTRNIGFYDNHVSNTSTLLSLDPLWGGPFYCFRNVAVNTGRGPFKLNSQESGFLIYSNTIVRTEGEIPVGWIQYNNGNLRNWSYRNNILVYRGTGDPLVFEAGGNDPIDFTHNAWYPDGDVSWSSTGGDASSFAAIRLKLYETEPVFGTSRHRHDGDVVVGAEPFTTPLPLGADYLDEVTTQFVPTLGATSAARNAGTPIPNVTDGYSGAAPDMGAIISGRPVPAWGVRP
ncbi:MAG: hypothetical protein L6Q95_11555 [Planctomycetes bacterium]|nr:hypothetical protein [Planctomycetota bacterium]